MFFGLFWPIHCSEWIKAHLVLQISKNLSYFRKPFCNPRVIITKKHTNKDTQTEKHTLILRLNTIKNADYKKHTRWPRVGHQTEPVGIEIPPLRLKVLQGCRAKETQRNHRNLDIGLNNDCGLGGARNRCFITAWINLITHRPFEYSERGKYIGHIILRIVKLAITSTLLINF